MRDTLPGVLLGAVASFGAAVLFYRGVNHVFRWIFAVYVSDVASWALTVVIAIALILIAMRVWSRWRIVLGSSLLFFSVWTVLFIVPKIHTAASSVRGYYDDRFVLVNTSAAWCTAIVLSVVGLVALGREVVVGTIQHFTRRPSAPGKRRAG